MAITMVFVQAAILVLCFSSFGVCQRRRARCDMHPDSNLDVESVTGPVYMEQRLGKQLKFIANLTYNGYPPSPNPAAGKRYLHAIHIHTYAPKGPGKCQTTGGDYNPTGVNHGGRTSSTRHYGDLGNARHQRLRGYIHTFKVNQTTLFGPYSIIGRSIVIHQKQDDLGQGGNAQSLIDGNSGKVIACCEIIETFTTSKQFET